MEDVAGNISAPVSTDIFLAAADLSAARVYPNPWRADRHGGYAVTFDQLTPGATVKIFTVAGHWVKSITASSSGSATWDLSTDSGDRAASGLYIFLITDDQNNKTSGKVVIVK
jgi:hypothetical protein